MKWKFVMLRIMVFLACCVHSANILSFSVLLPLMVESPELPTDCETPKRDTGPRLAWTHLEQGVALAGLGVGYFLALLVSAPVNNALGPRWVVTAATVASGASMALLPPAARLHWGAALVVRAVTGAGGGVIPDSVLTLMSRWVPHRDKNKFFAVGGVAAFVGVCGSWLACGLLVERVTWPCVMYVLGALAVLCGAVWGVAVRDEPDEAHDSFSDDVRDTVSDLYADYIPLGTVFSSCPFLSLACTHFADVWGITLLFLLMPKFVYEVLSTDTLKTTLVCTGAAACRFIVGCLLVLIVKCMNKYDCMDLTSVRKMFVFFSHPFTGITIVAVGYVGCSPQWMLIVLSLAMALSGFASVTSESNVLDLSPAFARILYVCMHFFALTSTIILPVVMGLFVFEEDYFQGWIHVFYVTATIYIISGFIFLIFGSGDVQPWNFPHLFMMAHTSLDGNSAPPTSQQLQKLQAARGKGRDVTAGRLRRQPPSGITQRPDA